ncbi:hypothetical protein WJX73_005266 [Symbiochloris irregularis]|uniref:Uncharacterized protein n=1 Tax=Symbiochloris irregularis TaxID=706552 RepID=A0AAW1PSD6_9CHLO
MWGNLSQFTQALKDQATNAVKDAGFDQQLAAARQQVGSQFNNIASSVLTMEPASQHAQDASPEQPDAGDPQARRGAVASQPESSSMGEAVSAEVGAESTRSKGRLRPTRVSHTRASSGMLMQPGSPHDHDSSPFAHPSADAADMTSTEAPDGDLDGGWSFQDVPLSSEPPAASPSRNGDHSQQDFKHRPQGEQQAAGSVHTHGNGDAASERDLNGASEIRESGSRARSTARERKLAEENAQLRSQLQRAKQEAGAVLQEMQDLQGQLTAQQDLRLDAQQHSASLQQDLDALSAQVKGERELLTQAHESAQHAQRENGSTAESAPADGADAAGAPDVAELKARITKAKRQLLSLKAKLGEATTARDAALADVTQLREQLQAAASGQSQSAEDHSQKLEDLMQQIADLTQQNQETLMQQLQEAQRQHQALTDQEVGSPSPSVRSSMTGGFHSRLEGSQLPVGRPSFEGQLPGGGSDDGGGPEEAPRSAAAQISELRLQLDSLQQTGDELAASDNPLFSPNQQPASPRSMQALVEQINDLMSQRDQLQQCLQEAESMQRSLQEELDHAMQQAESSTEATQALAALQSQHDLLSHQQKLKAADEQVGQLNAQMREMSRGAEEHQGSTQGLQGMLTQQMEVAQQLKDALTERSAELAAVKEAATAEAARAEASLAAAQKRATAAETLAEDLRGAAVDIESDLIAAQETSQRQLAAAHARAQEAEARAAASQSEAASLEASDRNAALEREMDEASAQLSAAQRELTAAQAAVAEHQQLANERQKRFSLLSATFKKKESGFSAQLNKAQQESATMRSELSAVQEEAASARKEAEAAEAKLQEVRHEAAGLQERCTRAEAQAQTAAAEAADAAARAAAAETALQLERVTAQAIQAAPAPDPQELESRVSALVSEREAAAQQRIAEAKAAAGAAAEAAAASEARAAAAEAAKIELSLQLAELASSAAEEAADRSQMQRWGSGQHSGSDEAGLAGQLREAELAAKVCSRRATTAEAEVEKLQQQLQDSERRAESLAWQIKMVADPQRIGGASGDAAGAGRSMFDMFGCGANYTRK